MRQNDYYKKKNFANPNIFQSSNNSNNDRNMSAPNKPVAGRPDPAASVTNNTGNTGGGNTVERPPPANTNNNAKDEKKNDEELGTGHFFKHPLQNTWALWYKDIDPAKSWEENLHMIQNFDTVEDFWSLYNHIKPPSEIRNGTDYSIFKQGIRPMWEDQSNKAGGCWTIVFNKPSGKAEMDPMWLDVILCLIGEAFEYSDEINGAVLTSRKYSKISIWTANATNTEAVISIGRKLREALRIGNSPITYHLHKDVMAKTGSVIKAIHSL